MIRPCGSNTTPLFHHFSIEVDPNSEETLKYSYSLSYFFFLFSVLVSKLVQESIVKVLPAVHGSFLARLLRHMLDDGQINDRDYERLAFVHELLLSEKCQVQPSVSVGLSSSSALLVLLLVTVG